MASLTASIKKKLDKTFQSAPKICGVQGCDEPCAIYINHKDVSRCAKCYQRDIDNYGRSATQFMSEAAKDEKKMPHDERVALLRRFLGGF